MHYYYYCTTGKLDPSPQDCMRYCCMRVRLSPCVLPLLYCTTNGSVVRRGLGGQVYGVYGSRDPTLPYAWSLAQRNRNRELNDKLDKIMRAMIATTCRACARLYEKMNFFNGRHVVSSRFNGVSVR